MFEYVRMNILLFKGPPVGNSLYSLVPTEESA